MLRDEFAQGTDLGRQAKVLMDAGELVPDRIVVAMTVARLAWADCNAGWILDGFPRALEQAVALDTELGDAGVQMAIALVVAHDVIIGRIGGRRMCANGHVYHVVHNPPQTPGVCDADGDPLFQRDDDTEEVIVRRIEVYERESAPLFDFYDSKGLLVWITAVGTASDTYNRVKRVLSGARLT